MGAMSVSRKAFFILAAIAAALLAVVIAPAQAHAVDNVSYIEKYWSGTQVVSVSKTANNCFPIDDDTTGLEDGAWYVVNSNVDSNERLIVKGTANIILCDGVKLTLDDGIKVPAGKTLNIYGQAGNSGELYCHADTNDNAAIGANDQDGDCGNINIHGGQITADTKTKGTNAAGIGGGDEGNGGNVTIYGGNVTAIGGEFGAGIGGGDRDGDNGGNNGTTRIYGGTVNATGGDHGAGIGGGELGSGGTVIIEGGEVTATGGTDAAGIGGGQGGSGGTITIGGDKVTATGGSASSNGGAGIGGGGAGSSGTIAINGGEVTAQGGANAAGIGGGDEGGVDTISILGDKVKATGGSQNGDGGAGIGGGNERGGGEITIYRGEVTAQGGADAAGIGGGDNGGGGTIVVFSGTVNATGGKYGAGIGGGQGQSGGTTKILGGSVTAQGGEYGAGIGGGQKGDGGTIEVDTGTVNATGGTDSAGLGGGEDGDGGTINVMRGNVTANGGVGGAGIGGGDGVGVTEAGNSGNITISGGTVNATGGAQGAGIGGGNSGDSGNSGTIAISGGTVIATGGGENPDNENPKGAAAIGGGNAQTGGTIQITGGDVTARASYRSAGIGGGGEASGGNINITGGTVKAYGGAMGKNYRYIYPEGGAGIGGGYKNSGGTITIGGDASVTAHGAEGAAGIGGGREGKSGTITINGGTVDASTGQHGGAGIGSGFICRDSGTTVNVTINGGTVKAVGGASVLQSATDTVKYFWSHPGAGIGAGGCADYMNRDDREYHSYFTGSINLNGGTIDAFAGNNDVGLSNAVIGGIELGDTATITVKGGCTVKVHAGRALMKASEVKLEDADGYSSRVRNLNNTSEIASTDQRVAWCKGENGPSELLIEPCKHESAAYVDNGDNHSYACPHCAYSRNNEDHAYGEPVWDWGENLYSAKATFTCGDCKHVETVDAFIEKSSTGYYMKTTATATIGGKTYTATMYTYNVTFKVENGSWDEGEGDAATAARTVTLSVPAGTDAKLSADQIPAVGTKPNAGYKAGAWDEAPSTDTAITENTTYTYRYESDPSGWAKLTYSLTLQDSIDVNFHVSELVGDPSEYTVGFGPGEEGSEGWKTETLERAGDNKVVVASRAAKEMGDEVHVIVKHGDDVIKDARYSVKGYCDAVIKAGESTYAAELVDLCKATLDYGSYAQEAFGYKADAPVNGGEDFFDNAGISVPAYGATKEDKSDAITGVSVSLVTTSKTRFVARFKTTATSAEGFSAKVNGTDVTPTYENGRIKVVVEGIAATDLATRREIVVTDPAGGTFAYTASPVDYMGLAVSKNVQAELNRAFYNYYYKARAALPDPGPSLQSKRPGAAVLTTE